MVMEKQALELLKCLKMYKKIFNNVLSLGVVQASNFLIPLLLMPYLINVYGIKGYGKIAFVQTLSYFIFMIYDYGFGLSAVKKLSKISDNDLKNKSTVNIFFSQSIICTALLLILLLIAANTDIFSDYKVAIKYIWLLTISYLFIPVWIYQSYDQINLCAMLQLLAKLMMLISILLIVNEEVELSVVIFLQGMSNIIIGFLGFLLLQKRLTKKIKIILFSFRDVFEEIKDGTSLFISKVSIVGYTSAISVGVGFFLGPYYMGIFSIADKIRGAGQAFLIPISQAILPRISSQTVLQKYKNIILTVSLLVIVFISLAIYVGILIFGEEIIRLITQESEEQVMAITGILDVIAMIIIFVGISNWCGIQVMIPNNKEREFTKIIVFVSCLTVSSFYFVITKYGLIGVSYLFLGAEFLVALLMSFVVIKFRRDFFG